MKIALADADAEIEAAPMTGGHQAQPELDRLSHILKTFNDHFGTLFDDADRIVKRILDDIAPKVAASTTYQNARENTPHTARMAHDQALNKVMQILLKDDTQVYERFTGPSRSGASSATWCTRSPARNRPANDPVRKPIRNPPLGAGEPEPLVGSREERIVSDLSAGEAKSCR